MRAHNFHRVIYSSRYFTLFNYTFLILVPFKDSGNLVSYPISKVCAMYCSTEASFNFGFIGRKLTTGAIFKKKSQLELFFQKSSVDLCRSCLGPSWMMMTNMMAWHDDEMIWWWSSQCLNVTAQFQWPKIFGQILAKIGGDVDVESKLPVLARSVPPPMYTRGEPRGRNACLRLWWRRWWWSRKQYWCWW